MNKEIHFRWEWDLKSPPEKLWPYIADTNRFNADAGIPGVKRSAVKAEGAERLEMTVAGMRMEWDEAPFEWTAPRKFGVVRNYHAGPMERIRVSAELEPRTGGGTHLVYQIWMTPRGFLGKVVIPLQMKWKSRPAFEAVFRKYDEFAQQPKPAAIEPAAVTLAPGADGRLAQIAKGLRESGRDEAMIDRLIGLVKTGDDLTLMRLRPYAVAEKWGVPRRKVLELCLFAVRAGLLDFRWDMLCPSCRGAKGVSERLSGIQKQVHCESCNIDFEVNFERSVELTFRPNPSVRKIDVAEFCVGGPRVTPHIAAQQVLGPGENRSLELALEPGTYRVRARSERGGQSIRVADGGAPAAEFAASADGWPERESLLAPNSVVRFENRTPRPQILLLERTAWSDEAVTAAEVTGLQVFRDLFASEALRPGEEIEVGSLCVLFTDLLESTRMYHELGDARAFGLVMQHFDVLKRHVAEEDGALVKTIGDAVLAIFRRPVSAVRALLKASEELAQPKAGGRPLMLKAGIHFGPAIAVTLNDRLDYFGSTVNITARLVGLCSGGDLVISSQVRNDAEVSALLAGSGHRVEELRASLKGFDTTKFELMRVVPRWSLAKSDLPKTPKTQKF
ncbi:MAG: adenylate/guanylate cyclase domain-containing protein [Planctomycetes bacterium]|nr:adenylate/guanylate cyclase domain-containing protein [Planctomycetota bacterium]